MDSRRQPTIWGNHNLSNIAGEAFRRNTEREKAQAVNKALQTLTIPKNVTYTLTKIKSYIILAEPL